MTSLLKSRLPALLLALYLFSFWALPQGWNEENLLDGSWRYALGRFRELGFSLGRDSWFTYGPLAHWFGAPSPWRSCSRCSCSSAGCRPRPGW